MFGRTMQPDAAQLLALLEAQLGSASISLRQLFGGYDVTLHGVRARGAWAPTLREALYLALSVSELKVATTPPAPLSQHDREQMIGNAIWTFAVEGVTVTREQAEAALDKALSDSALVEKLL